MKPKTIEEYTNIFKEVKESNKSLRAYCSENNINYNNIISLISIIKKENDHSADEMISLYNSITQKDVTTKAEYSILRNEDDVIEGYDITVYLHDKKPFHTILNREECEMVFGLYTYYGGNITARNVANEFPKFTLAEVKYIFRAFNLTKDSFWAPQHLVEELTKEELSQYRMNLKERAAFKYADATQERDFKKTLNKIAQENLKLRKQLEEFSDFKIEITDVESVQIPEIEYSGQGINLYLSDIHLGSYVTSGSLYKENSNYGYEEAKRRLREILYRVYELGGMDFINICLMGDNIDCCGFTGLTSRRDHIMPENMDAREQANKFIQLIMWFTKALLENKITSKINFYSVPSGNHDGDFGYLTVKALFATINATYPDFKTVLFEEFYGKFEVGIHTFIMTHGNINNI